MKKGLILAAFISCVWLLPGGCTPTLKQTSPGEIADPYYRPKRVYSLNYEEAWDLTIKGLRREGVSLKSSDKDTGVLRTDYENVSVFDRNRCDLRFSPEASGQTYIHILCRVEARPDLLEPFRDLTYTYPVAAMKAEENLYRRIERPLLAAEKARVQQQMAAREQIKNPAIPRTPAPPVRDPAPAVSPAVHTQAEPARPFPSSAGNGTRQSWGALNRAGLEVSAPEAVKTAPRTETRPNFLRTMATANARMAPSTQGQLVTVLAEGEKAERVGTSGMWTKLKLFSGEIVWVHNDFLQEVKAGESVPAISAGISGNTADSAQTKRKTPAKQEKAPAAPAAPALKAPLAAVVDGSKMDWETKAITKMRAEPSPTAKVVLVLKKGRQVTKIEESGEYSKVKLSWGDTGWVLTRSLTNL